MTKIYVADAGKLCDDALFAELIKKVPAERQKKIERYRFRKDKNLSLAAGVLLLHAMENAGIDPDSAVIKTGEAGKPYMEITDDQGSPSGMEIREAQSKSSGSGSAFYFNLSHSGEISVCAVSDREVGCDVEKIRSLEEVDIKLSERFFAKEESEYVKNAAGDDAKSRAFFEIWTKKESFVKAEGSGLSFGLDRFSVLEENSPQKEHRGFAEVTYSEEKYYLTQVPTGLKEYSVSVCTKHSADVPELVFVDLLS